MVTRFIVMILVTFIQVLTGKDQAGTGCPLMLEHEVEFHHCGTHLSGWLNGNHPTDNDQIVDRQVCFGLGSDSCCFNVQVQVIKCGTYFLYYLEDTPTCSARNCSE